MEINKRIDERVKVFEEKVKDVSDSAEDFGLSMLKEMQSLSRVLVSRELRRIKNRFGEDDPRVKDLQQGLKQSHVNIQDVTRVQSDVAVSIPDTAKGETLLQGKIRDESGRGVTGLTVMMQDNDGNEIAREKVRTDASGYFAVKVSPEVMERSTDADWTFSVLRDDGEKVYTHASPIKLVPEKNLLINTVVSRDKLRPAAVGEMLRAATTDKPVKKQKPRAVDVEKLKEQGYVVLGNKRSKEIHDLNNIQKGCQIDEITAANRAPFKSEENAIKKGYDYCAYCYGPEKSRH